ncbi:hypothetical protein N7E02_04045 (plasmid) [Aliirhizobium terrae]|uniref:hypothetical protein n=1 Tax=Terrirhizobium terrae TaxID=2926709 RepID=UPI0025773FB6|nr:hypothetical protein [Rhizobium sp. CC-CFT758]WJH38584.1 hypothetical protein N7E02_04045 [Rhizobium sp. CC-CFT758]
MIAVGAGRQAKDAQAPDFVGQHQKASADQHIDTVVASCHLGKLADLFEKIRLDWHDIAAKLQKLLLRRDDSHGPLDQATAFEGRDNIQAVGSLEQLGSKIRRL